MRYQPFSQYYPLTSGWGERWGTLHDGADWACPEGTPVYSCHSGTVYVRPWDEGGYGWWVEIVGDDGFTTQYGHLSNSNVVSSGSWQPAGTLIAYSGNTGGSTGPHLHLRVKNTGASTGFDPLPWLDGAPYVGETSSRGPLADTTEADVYHWCKANGLNDAAAAGVMGNLRQESNFWWDAIECSGRVGNIPLDQALSYIVPGRCEGMGVLQWSFDRRNNLIDYVQSTGRQWYDSSAQLDFMLKEINESSTYRKMWSDLNSLDARGAAELFDNVFVRSGIKGSRFDYADEFYRLITAGSYNRDDLTLGFGIAARYKQLTDEQKAVFGEQKTGELTDGDWRVAYWSGGAIAYHPNVGLRIVYGEIFKKWFALAVGGVKLGYPLEDEKDGPVPGSRVSEFQRGRIYFSPETGAHEMYGQILFAYEYSKGWTKLGLPVSGEIDGPVAGSRKNVFQKGTIYWSHSTGAHAVTQGFATRHDESEHGLPTGPEVAIEGGSMQNFQKGRMYWKAAGGAIAFVSNFIVPTLDAAGGVQKVGFPQDNNIPALLQEFDNKRIVVSSKYKLVV